MWCRTGFTNLIRVKVKVKEKKILKVGKKRKKDKKHTKLDCQDSSSRFSASCWFRVPETSPRSQENKIQDTFDLWILCQEQSRDPPSRKETLLTRFQTQMRCKKSDVNRANIFCRKKLQQKRVWPSFNGRLSWCSIGAANSPTNKASRIFVAQEKANRPWEIKESFLAFWL